MARLGRPGTTPEAITDDLVSLATDLAKKKLEDGTASSQLIALYAKEGTPAAILQRRKLEAEVELIEAKTKAHNDMADSKEAMDEVLRAFKEYSGAGIFGGGDFDEEIL